MNEQKTKLLPYEIGQDYIAISDFIGEKLGEHDNKLVDIEAARFMALLGDELEKLESHCLGIYSSEDFFKEHGKGDVISRLCYGEYAKHDYIKSIHKQIVVTEMNRLKEENEKLKKCVEYYADQKNWSSNGKATPIDRAVDDIENCDGNMFFGGARARKCLGWR